MFSGIITARGRIERVQALADGVRITVVAPDLALDDVALGDSIANSGVCLTVVALDAAAGRMEFDVSRETLNCTVGLDVADGELNLEKALRLSDRLGGHLVSGHVDGVGEVISLLPVGESHELRIRAPAELARFLARKGSLTVDGVSLTLNQCEGSVCSINLISHTMENTTLQHLQAGSRVNLEVDLLARYVAQILDAQTGAQT